MPFRHCYVNETHYVNQAGLGQCSPPFFVNHITSFWKSSTLSSYSLYHHIQRLAKKTLRAASLLGQYMYFNQRNIRQGKLMNS